MSRTYVFVHGTGVRGSAFARSFRLVREQLRRRDPSAEVVGCFWGEAEGAALRMGGASIPRYEDSGGEPVTEAEEDIALWDVLYTDPFYELRLIRHRSTADGRVAPGRLPPSEMLSQQVRTFSPSDQLRNDLVEYHLGDEFLTALEWVTAAPEFTDGLRTAPPDPLEHGTGNCPCRAGTLPGAGRRCR